MERPWFLTGDDEKLGVVLWPDPAGGFENYQKYVSLMGQDPIHSSNPPLAVLRQEHFPNRSAFSRDNLLLRELPGTNVNVAAFDVQYNEERGLWYADLFFDPQMSTSYYPFVRLALARYQPYSVQDVELSPVVLADFIQLAPDRHLTHSIPRRPALLIHRERLRARGAHQQLRHRHPADARPRHPRRAGLGGRPEQRPHLWDADECGELLVL